MNVAVRIERVDLCRADEEAIFRFALGAADFCVHFYVHFFIDFEHVLSELFFDLQGCGL